VRGGFHIAKALGPVGLPSLSMSATSPTGTPSSSEACWRGLAMVADVTTNCEGWGRGGEGQEQESQGEEVCAPQRPASSNNGVGCTQAYSMEKPL
jgi:hypothetical protein